MEELGKKNQMGTLYSDSQSAIFLAKNPTFHSRTKHIQIRYHFVRLLLDDGQLLLEKICGSKNSADMLTKGVTLEKQVVRNFSWSSSMKTGAVSCRGGGYHV